MIQTRVAMMLIAVAASLGGARLVIVSIIAICNS